MARRGSPELLVQLDDGRRSTGRRDLTAQRDERAAGSTSSRSRSASCGAPAKPTRPSSSGPRAGRWATRRRRSPPTGRRRAAGAGAAAAHPEHPVGTGPRRARRGRQPGREGPVQPARALRGPPAGPALGDGHGPRHPRQRAGGEDQRRDVHDATRSGRHARRGPCASSRSTATPTRSRRCARRRSSPRPRSPPPGSSPSSPTTRTPSSATASGASRPPRCRSPRSPPARSSTRPTCRCASWPTRRATGARPARPGATRGACCASTSSTRSRSWPTPRPSRRRPCSTSWSAGRGHHRRARLAYRIVDICTGDLGQSHHRSFDIEVYAPGARLARGVVGELVQRLPGPPGQHPLPARRREGHGGPPHPERLGAGRAPGVGRDRREPPPARRQRGAPRGAVAVPARPPLDPGPRVRR